MKKIICLLILAVLILSFSTSSANGLTLPEKLKKQLQVGNGLKGSFAIHANADVQTDPLLYAIQNAEYEIRGEMLYPGEDLHYYIGQQDEEDKDLINNQTELYRKDGVFYLRSDFIGDQVFVFPDQDMYFDSVISGSGENKSIFPALVKLLSLSDEEKKSWEPVKERLSKKLEMWLSGFSAETSYQTKEGSSPALTVSYTIPMEAVFQYIPEMITEIRDDTEAMGLVQSVLSGEEIDLYLNPNHADYYKEALAKLEMKNDLFFSKTVSTLGDVIHTVVAMPLDEAKTGYSMLTVTADNTTVTYQLSAEKRMIQISLPEEKKSEEPEETFQMTMIRIDESIPKEDNQALRITVRKTHTEYDDEENGKLHQSDHWSITAEKDISILPSNFSPDLISDFETVQIEADLHFSSKYEPSSPTVLEFTINSTQNSLTVEITGKIKTAQSWPFYPFNTDQAILLDPAESETVEKTLTQWAAGALTRIRHLPEEAPAAE